MTTPAPHTQYVLVKPNTTGNRTTTTTRTNKQGQVIGSSTRVTRNDDEREITRGDRARAAYQGFRSGGSLRGGGRGGPFFGNPNMVAYAWLAAMAIVSVDEWKNNGILPRPARLWDTSLTFGLLAFVGMVDALTPLANAFAVGYVIILLYQFYNGAGAFEASGGLSGSAPKGGTRTESGSQLV